MGKASNVKLSLEERKARKAESQRKWRVANKKKIAEEGRKYREANKEKIAEYQRKWCKANKEKIAEYQRKWCKANNDKSLEISRKYYAANKEKIAEEGRKYREANKGKIAERRRKYRKANKAIIDKTRSQWVADNKEKVAEYKRNWHFEKLKTNSSYKLCVLLRSRLCVCISTKQKTGSAVRDMGCTGQEACDHLESLFDENMTWENWGTYWHVDHIFPLAGANKEDRAEFLAVNNWRNLQPLEAKANLSKGDKVTPAARRLFNKLVKEFS